MNQDIFKPRVNILPYEYPQLLAYKDAIRHSYWIDTNLSLDANLFVLNYPVLQSIETTPQESYPLDSRI
jgi:hypothetical protein